MLWYGTTFVSLFFARELSGVTVLGWPVPFYMAALGLPMLYLFIIVLDAWRMRRIEYGQQHVERRG